MDALMTKDEPNIEAALEFCDPFEPQDPQKNEDLNLNNPKLIYILGRIKYQLRDGYSKKLIGQII